jgi:hypothetical protein
MRIRGARIANSVLLLTAAADLSDGSERAARDGRAKIRSIMQRIAGPVQ